MNIMTENKTILAIPKGRILEELLPLLKKCGIEPEKEFSSENSRKLQFSTNLPDLDIIRVRAFDVATFVAYGAADFGIVGSDVLEEFDYNELYAPLDLKIGRCRLSTATHKDLRNNNNKTQSHIRVVTKYPNLTRKHFAKKGIQAECIKLNGAMEIAPTLKLADMIVDLVSTGSTLKANSLIEIDTILSVSSKLIVNRSAMKTRTAAMQEWVTRFDDAIAAS